jgi:hypothetical protein
MKRPSKRILYPIRTGSPCPAKSRKGMATPGWLRWNNDQGMVMVMAVMILTVVILLAITAAITSTAETRLTGRSYQVSQVFNMAEGIAEYGADALNSLLQVNLNPTQGALDVMAPPSLPTGYALDEYTLRKVGDFYPEVITTGDFLGLNAYIQKYEVEVQVSRSNETTRIYRALEHEFIPLFQFGVFYQDDLEIFPGPEMIFDGRVHCNANIFVGAETEVKFNSFVTAVGHIYHWRKDGPHDEPTGPVRVRDYWGVYQNMYQSGYWLDADCANWETEAIARWGGTVRDSSHGVHELRLPVPQVETLGEGQIAIIKRGQVGDSPELKNARYYWKAGIRVLDGIPYDTNGVYVDMGPGTITFSSFYDQREHRTMYAVQLNIAAMIANGTTPANGIIYFSGSLLGDAVRLVNGTTMPNGGLTVASENPIYIKGNYNTTPKRNAAVIGDAVTILSGNWNDANSTHSLSYRTATETRVNACIMTGNTETPFGGDYNGGLENLPRFLENWTGRWFRFRGSFVDLWHSEQAVGVWSYGTFYTAPNRDWGFDNDLLSPTNWPPGSPRLHTVQRGAWRQIS